MAEKSVAKTDVVVVDSWRARCDHSDHVPPPWTGPIHKDKNVALTDAIAHNTKTGHNAIAEPVS